MEHLIESSIELSDIDLIFDYLNYESMRIEYLESLDTYHYIDWLEADTN